MSHCKGGSFAESNSYLPQLQKCYLCGHNLNIKLRMHPQHIRSLKLLSSYTRFKISISCLYSMPSRFMRESISTKPKAAH